MEEKIDRLSRADYEHRLMIKAVWYYYIENYTQQNISHLLGVSRSKVIALLERARQTGIIQFNVQQDSSRRMEMERELLGRYGLRDAFLVPGAATLTNPNESIAQAAAMYILRRAADNAFINMGYGDTTSRILNHLATAAQLPLNVVSLAGGVNYYLPNMNSNVFNARLYLIPSPLLLSSAGLRDSLRREPDVEEIFRMIPLGHHREKRHSQPERFHLSENAGGGGGCAQPLPGQKRERGLPRHGRAAHEHLHGPAEDAGQRHRRGGRAGQGGSHPGRPPGGLSGCAYHR